MDVSTAIGRVENAVRANRVYGEPITVDGVTVVTAARVGGGAGGGTGRDQSAGGEGAGGGLGWTGRPSGAFVLRDGNVRWQPAVDVNRLVTAVAAVLVTAMLTARAIIRAQTSAKK